mgnify:CR=1 FL=1
MKISEEKEERKMRSISHFPIRICAEASQIPRMRSSLLCGAELKIQRVFLSVETLRNGGKNG